MTRIHGGKLLLTTLALAATTTDRAFTRGDGAFDLEAYHHRSADLLNAARQMFAAELTKQR